jgi:DNA-binding MarR family transcriptional regulator
LTRAQWSVLAYLCRNEGINQAGLAELMEIQPITLVRHLDRLEEAGWLERRPIPGDRRARALHLTAKAWPILDRMFALAAETWDDALSGLSLAAREQLLSSLARVRRNLSLGDTASAAGRDTGTDGG